MSEKAKKRAEKVKWKKYGKNVNEMYRTLLEEKGVKHGQTVSSREKNAEINGKPREKNASKSKII